ncbi:MAG: hypothetical protein IPP71_10270 [Bacteroidetes bacterium]|nr:hypothetical protein [Bacteroidota bacterium]
MADKSTIAFIEHLAPTLESGTYEISVHTSFNGTPGLENEKIGNLKEWIFVGGERFNLNPADVDSVYPGENTTGDYSDTFPHIVFSQGGFPWERQPKTGLNERITWLALLLFDEEDPAPTLKQIAIGDLIKEKIPNGFWFPKNFKPEPDEDPARLCNIIDVSKELFDQIKPTTGDLKYMAHAREVTIYNKARQGKIIQGSISEDATHLYSVVIGNRLPKPGKESVVHLVSLESYSDVLDNVNGIEGIHTVRMVSLKSWRFSCSDVGGTFLNHFTDLNGGLADNNIDIKRKATPVSKTQPLFLHYPIDKNEITDPWILKTMQQGYIPMQHKFRQGLSSISWYRGPLVPFSVNSFWITTFPFLQQMPYLFMIQPLVIMMYLMQPHGNWDNYLH